MNRNNQSTTVSNRKVKRNNFQQKEWEKCKSNPIYFITKYCFITHATKGVIKFNLWDFQIELIKKLLDPEYRMTAIVKSRQLGISTVMAAFALWLVNFYPAKKIAIVATDSKVSKKLHQKVKLMYENIPDFLREQYEKNNETVLMLRNQSEVEAFSHNKNKGVRSISGTLIIMDEAQFIEKAGDLWTSIQPSLRTGGQFVALSSPASPSGWFYDTCENAKIGDNNFKLIKLPWFLHPDSQLSDGSPDWDWRKQQDRELGKRKASQEYDAEFGFDEDSFFDVEFLETIEKHDLKDPIKIDGKWWYWEYPMDNESYTVSVDCAEGGGDNNTIHVLKDSTMEQVAEYQSDEHYTTFQYRPVEVARRYNNAKLVIEANSVGTSVVSKSIDLGYHNIYMRGTGKEKKILGTTKVDHGWKTTPKSRPLILESMRALIETDEGRLAIRSVRTMKELKSFAMINGKPQAKHGAKDDLVIPLAIACFLYSLHGTRVSTKSNSNMQSQLEMYALANSRTQRNYEKIKSSSSIFGNDIITDDEQPQEQPKSEETMGLLKLFSDKETRRIQKEFNWVL
jgi:hypothetical protein